MPRLRQRKLVKRVEGDGSIVIEELGKGAFFFLLFCCLISEAGLNLLVDILKSIPMSG